MKIQFTPSPALQYLAACFVWNQKSLRIVGGAVRDLLLSQEPKDIDLCTDATPEEMVQMAAEAKITLIPTGLQHGTVTFVIEGEAFEVTTLRIDTETDGRHADVIFTTSFEEDAARRDLTINAMSMDLDGTVYDYFGGQDDLKTGCIRFVGDPATRIQEDYLRILRYFRFMARFEGFEAPFVGPAIKQHAHGLAKISRERVWAEMSKLLVAPGCTPVVDQMYYYNIMQYIGLPQVDRLTGFGITNRMDNADDAVSALSCMIQSDGEAFARSWKMSIDEIKKLDWLVKLQGHQLYLFWVEDQLVNNVLRDWVVSACKLVADNRLAHHAETWEIPELPVRGQDLLDAGMKPGKEVGVAMDHIKRSWIASRFQLTKEELLNAVH